MHDELKMWRDRLKRAEDRMDQSRTDAEYAANLDIANHAARQVEAILYKINKW